MAEKSCAQIKREPLTEGRDEVALQRAKHGLQDKNCQEHQYYYIQQALIMLPQNGIQQCADHKWEEQTQPVGQHEQHCCYDEPPTIGTQERQNAGQRDLCPVTTRGGMFFHVSSRRERLLNFLCFSHCCTFLLASIRVRSP